jgi:hypothetical protein
MEQDVGACLTRELSSEEQQSRRRESSTPLAREQTVAIVELNEEPVELSHE